MIPCLDTSPHKHTHIYHTRGRTLSSQSRHTNESILCHEPSPRTIIIMCPSLTVYPTEPERSRTLTAEIRVLLLALHYIRQYRLYLLLLLDLNCIQL